MTEDEWRDWQAEWNREMYRVIAFLYAGFTQGRQRLLLDGIEPTGTAADCRNCTSSNTCITRSYARPRVGRP